MTTEQASVSLAPEDRVALITGASRGIGLATARSLAQRGFRIVITGREESDLARAVADLRALHPGVSAFAGDCADPAVVNALIHAIQRDFGRLDVVVNNAGGSHHASDFAVLSPEDWDQTLRQNLKSAVMVTQAALPLLKATGSASIVNVSSKAGRHRTDMAACDYVAAKAGLIGFTRQLAQELGPCGIRVNCVAPGITVTARVEKRWDQRPERVRAQVIAGIPLGRFALPEEIAAAIVFLASEEASYITGATLDVNGGAFMG
jgi:3-oxoacyl-[acyl-carrier protein] reductase